MSNTNNANLSAPWYIYLHELEAFFKEDPEVKVEFEDTEDSKTIKILVDNEEKADALAKLLPLTKEFGNVTVKVVVIPANEEEPIVELFRKAFEGNPVLKDIIVTEDTTTTFGASYIVFEKKVVQYFTDTLSDPNGYTSTLYQDIAKDVFGEIAFFTTSVED